MAVEERILIQLALRGMDPAQLEQIARLTGDQLEAKMREVYDKLNALHRQKAAAQTAEEKKKVDAQIAELEKLGKATTRVINSQQTNWRRLLEDMENVTVVLQGAFGAIGAIGGAVLGAAHKVKEWGDEVVKVTNIHNAFRGNLESLREATGGEISDLNLMIAHNRALAGGLELTGEQFEVVARAADDFADAVGESTEEGLNTLIRALTTGSEKQLKLLGVTVDNTKAEKAYAEALGLTVKELTEDQKLHAFRLEALTQLKNKTEVAIPPSLTVARAWEKTWAAISGSAGALAAIGNIELESASSYAVGVAIEKQNAAEKARMAAQSAAYGADLEAYGGDIGFGAGQDVTTPGLTTLGKDTQKALDAEARSRRQRAAASAAARKRELDQAFNPLLAQMYGSQAKGRGQSAEEDFQDLLAGAGGDKSMEDLAASVTETMLPSIEDRIRQMEEDLVSADVRAAGGGVLAQLLYGASGPEYAQTEMDIWKQGLEGIISDVQSAQGLIAQAAGDGVFNLIAGNQNKAFRQIAKDVLDTLGKMAMAKAIWYGLEAAGYGLVGLAPQAVASAKLAGAYGLAATTFGLGSRAMSADASAPSAAAATPRAVSDFGGQRASGPAGGSGITVVVNGALPGSEAEIGRNVSKAIEAYQRQYGKRAN